MVAPSLWNFLPQGISKFPWLAVYRKLLKNNLFRQAFNCRLNGSLLLPFLCIYCDLKMLF